MPQNEEPSEVFEGLMLGDGFLSRAPNPNRNSRFSLAVSGEEHLDWLYSIAGALRSLGIYTPSPGILTRLSARSKEPYQYVYLQTRTHRWLTAQRHRWYLGRHKTVPSEVIITPASLAHWFIGDGNTKREPNGSVTVTMCTGGFLLEELDLLVKACDRVGVRGFYPSFHQGTSYYLYMCSAADVNVFMDLVEPFVPPSYKFKVKWPELQGRYSRTHYMNKALREKAKL